MYHERLGNITKNKLVCYSRSQVTWSRHALRPSWLLLLLRSRPWKLKRGPCYVQISLSKWIDARWTDSRWNRKWCRRTVLQRMSMTQTPSNVPSLAVCKPCCIADRFADCQWFRVDRCKLVLPTRQTYTDHVACLDCRKLCSMTSIMLLRHPQLLELDARLHWRTSLRLFR